MLSGRNVLGELLLSVSFAKSLFTYYSIAATSQSESIVSKTSATDSFVLREYLKKYEGTSKLVLGVTVVAYYKATFKPFFNS